MLDTSGRGKWLMKDGWRLHFCQIVSGLIERNLNGVAKMFVLWLVIQSGIENLKMEYISGVEVHVSNNYSVIKVVRIRL